MSYYSSFCHILLVKKRGIIKKKYKAPPPPLDERQRLFYVVQECRAATHFSCASSHVSISAYARANASGSFSTAALFCLVRLCCNPRLPKLDSLKEKSLFAFLAPPLYLLVPYFFGNWSVARSLSLRAIQAKAEGAPDIVVALLLFFPACLRRRRNEGGVCWGLIGKFLSRGADKRARCMQPKKTVLCHN